MAGLEAGKMSPGFLPKRHVRGREMMGEEELGQLVCGEGSDKSRLKGFMEGLLTCCPIVCTHRGRAVTHYCAGGTVYMADG